MAKRVKSTLTRRLSLQLALWFGVPLAVVFVGLAIYQHRVEREGENARLLLAADTVVASLKSIMLASHGDIAQDWMKRIAAMPQFYSATVFRVDGTEAFKDQKTISHVNQFLGRQMFSRPHGGKPDHILSADFRAVAAQHLAKVLHHDGHRLTLLLPIHVDPPCLRCHGYTNNPLRGVLRLQVSSQTSGVVERKSANMALLALALVLMLALVVWWLLRREVLTDLEHLSNDVALVKYGQHGHRSTIARNDEIGGLAKHFNQMLDSMEQARAHEQAMLARQRQMTDGIISLSSDRVSDQLLRRIAKIAMQMTGAHYAMISHDEDGERQFIPIGMNDAEQARLAATPPQGKGLLGYLWQQHVFIRVDNLADHPASAGFPPGHAPMKALLGGPIMFEDTLMGVLYLTEKEGGVPFTEEDELLLRTLNSACGVALANAQNFALLEQRVKERTEALSSANGSLRHRELELEMANDELRRAGEFKDQFLANTSHELRTPLNAIIGFSELLMNPKMGDLNVKQAKFIANIHGSGKGLLSVINNLLDLSKIEAGMMDLMEESCRPALLLEDVIGIMQPLADKKSIALAGQCGLSPEQSLFSDPGKLRQVLINLIGNAIKFTPDGGSVSVSLALIEEADGLHLEGSVQDSGQGISAEDQKKIFDPFVQAESGLTRSHGGTGLGLSLTRKLVQMMGGNILVHSTLGEGSTFDFDVAVKPGDDQVIGSKVEAPQVDREYLLPKRAAPPKATEEVSVPVVLVVDDDNERASAVAEILQQGNYCAVLTNIERVSEVATAYDSFLVLLGVPEEPVEMYKHLQQLRSFKCTRDLPVTLLGGTAERPSFSFGTIDSVEKRLSDESLSEMLTHHNFPMTRQSNTSLVLVIDDEPSVREYMHEKLTSEGYQPLLAENGQQGLEMARTHQPDMIILDLMMPGMSGFEVVEELKRRTETADIPVMIFTAKDLNREEVMRLGQEVDKVLTKGAVGPKELLREMRGLEMLYPAQAKLIDATVRMYNRRYLGLRLVQECNRAERYQQPFSLVAWEITNFRSISAQHGTRAMNSALHAMSEQVRSTLRGGDIAVRLSEQRFVVLLTGIDAKGTGRVCEKLGFRLQSQQHKVGSFKVAMVSLCHSVGMQPQEMMDTLEQRIAAIGGVDTGEEG
ncbi:MAG: ATP-binding protein [Mariprofundales bacterium]|nr:ATP-binding protein [Mariprofundales bacterium]